MSNQDTQQQNSTQMKQPPVNPQQPVQPAAPPPPNAPTLAEPQSNQVAEGVNLIPSLTKEQKTQVKKKNTLNIGSILSIIVFVTISIGIVGFNIVTKSQLSSKQNSLKRIENTVKSKVDKITSNNVILKRIKLYQEVDENSFSHKEIIEFFLEISKRVAGITYDSIEISENLSFNVSGKGPDLEQLARLWYILGVNENIESVMLEGFSKTEQGANFSFEGVLILDNFKNE